MGFSRTSRRPLRTKRRKMAVPEARCPFAVRKYKLQALHYSGDTSKETFCRLDSTGEAWVICRADAEEDRDQRKERKGEGGHRCRMRAPMSRRSLMSLKQRSFDKGVAQLGCRPFSRPSRRLSDACFRPFVSPLVMQCGSGGFDP